MRPLRTLVPVTALALLAVATVLPAGAQAPPSESSLTMSAPDGIRLVPDGDAVAVPLSWSLVLAGPDAGPAWVGQFTISWESFDCGAGIQVTGSRTTVGAMQPGSFTASGEAPFTLAATSEAPGVEPVACTVAGVASSGQGTTVEGEATFRVLVAFRGALSVNVPSTIKQAGPDHDLAYDLDVTNTGNAAATVTVALAKPAPEAWKVTVPAPFELARGATATVQVRVHAPGDGIWNNREQDFRLTVTPASSEGEAGEPVEVGLLARVRGFDAPGPWPLVAALAVVAAAAVAGTVLLRRRRKAA